MTAKLPSLPYVYIVTIYPIANHITVLLVFSLGMVIPVMLGMVIPVMLGMVIPVMLGMVIPVIVINSSSKSVVVVRCQSAVSLSSLLGLQYIYIMILSY